MAAPAVHLGVTHVRAADLATFTRQLGAMLDAGVDVLRALKVASQHSGSARLEEASRHIAEKMTEGKEFYQTLAPYPDLFDPFYVEMARQGENDGLLGKALLSVADYLDQLALRQGPQTLPPTSGAPAWLAALAMLILGVQALGAAAIWSIATARPEILSLSWTGPLAAFWCAVCLLSGSWILSRLRQSRPAGPAGPAPRPVPLPPKSPTRRMAEAEAVVRSTLLDQEEAREPRIEPRPNGKGVLTVPPGLRADEIFPEEGPPRFDP